jgi:hypothetical protein
MDGIFAKVEQQAVVFDASCCWFDLLRTKVADSEARIVDRARGASERIASDGIIDDDMWGPKVVSWGFFLICSRCVGEDGRLRANEAAIAWSSDSIWSSFELWSRFWERMLRSSSRLAATRDWKHE